MKKNNHTFVICAYKEEHNLEECVKSLVNQTCKSKVIISTSTPNDYISSIAKKYNVELRINKGKSSHLKDFWFAYDQCDTKYVTLCHQDDIYYPEYGEKMINALEKEKQPIIAFSNYYERRNGETIKSNTLLKIKRLINFPLKFFKKSKFIRRLTLSVGNAICCPSVTYNKQQVEKPLIDTNYKSNLDWVSYVEFAKQKGSFVYLSEALMEHRIHEGSTTSKVISDNSKQKEDYEIFRMFWPDFIAKILLKIYGTSEKSNIVNKQKEGRNYMKYLMVIIYLILTVSGLILYKYGTKKEFDISFVNKVFQIKLNIYSIVGLICYFFSFIIYMIVLPRFDLSFIMPITSGISYVSILVMSAMVLKESITIYGMVGSIFILIGIIIMNLKR